MYAKSSDLYDDLYAWKDYDAEVRALRPYLPRPVRGRRPTLLDVACGTGKHLERLRERFDVEGVDASREMLARARRRLPGVRLHHARMERLDLGRTFDVVTCLFSSIGYVKTLAGLRRACARLAAHVAPGGVLLVEPWFSRAAYRAGSPHMNVVDRPDKKIARLSTSRVRGRLSVMDMHHVVATPAGTRHVVERHELGLFSDAEYRGALEATGLRVRRDPQGPMGRGLWVARRRIARPGRTPRTLRRSPGGPP